MFSFIDNLTNHSDFSIYSWKVLCYKIIGVIFINIFINCFKLYSVIEFLKIPYNFLTIV